LTSHNAFLYNPKTNKFIEKSVHINRIKPCYQRDDQPEDDENIEVIPFVEITYPTTFPNTLTTPIYQRPHSEPTDAVIATYMSIEIDDPTSSPTANPQRTIEQRSTHDPDTNTAQQGSISDNAPEQPFWNALKIVKQSTGKGKPRYLIRWEDATAPDSWSDTADVSDKLKRVFYLTHTKTGARRIHPLNDTEHPTLTNSRTQ